MQAMRLASRTQIVPGGVLPGGAPVGWLIGAIA